MNTKYWISDTHFCHRMITEFEPNVRQFTDVEAHDETLIENWNNKVGRGDTITSLGDVVFQVSTKTAEILPRLNGCKRLVLGNHEHSNIPKYYADYFNKIQGYICDNKRKIIFSHVPVHPHVLSTGRFDWNVHGHLHSDLIDDIRYINISCEHTNLAPVSNQDLLDVIAIRRELIYKQHVRVTDSLVHWQHTTKFNTV